MQTIFIRNDDVRSVLDPSLVFLTKALLEDGFCLSHAVEPANVTSEVANWLLATKKLYPDNLEIIQHGYNHEVRCTSVLGEFGGRRDYQSQYCEIKAGSTLMDNIFGREWFKVFSFPYGEYNIDTLRALDKLEYKAISTGVKWSRKRRAFNHLGRILGRKILASKKVVYCGVKPPGHYFMELPVMLNTTREYLSPDGGIQRSVKELQDQWECIPNCNPIGILLHHRFNSLGDVSNLLAFLRKLRSENVICKTMKEIYESKMDHL